MATNKEAHQVLRKNHQVLRKNLGPRGQVILAVSAR